MSPMRPVTINPSSDGPQRDMLQFNMLHAMRQVGWLGQTGNVYAYDEEATAREQEPGGYSPLYLEIDR